MSLQRTTQLRSALHHPLASYLAATMLARRTNQAARGPRSKTQVLAYQYYLQGTRHCYQASKQYSR
jgi:hypothetical protein